MNDASFAQDTRTKTGAPHVATLLVSVFLVLLAFFVALNSLSNFDADRSRAVLNSVNESFSGGSGAQKPEDYGIDIASFNAFVEDAKISIATIVPLYEMKVAMLGNSLQMTMPTMALFDGNGAILREDRAGFYAVVLDVLQRWNPRANISIRMVQGLFGDAKLETARGGNFASFMENEGVSPKRISIAISEDKPDTVTLIFDVTPLVEEP